MIRQAGELSSRITVESAAKTQNAVGETVLSWSTVATVWAKVEPLAGREAERYGEIVGLNGHKVTIRHRSDITSAMRIIYRSRTLEIGAVNEFLKDSYLELICTEKTAS
jgi:SPP1 family predicted phage head-tail adaptor